MTQAPESAAPAQHLLLHTLPPGHSLRQQKLQGSQCRNLLSKEWRTIQPSWAISKVCFDQLGDAWLSTSEFRVAITCEPAQ